ncbi:MAG: NUDIX hydrolase [Candidatus Saccharimonadales bacterium]
MEHTYTDQERQKWLQTLPKRVSSATLIIENENGQVIVEKAHYKRYWTFPGGIIDPGETPKQAAVRETREEIGLTIDPELVSFVAVATRVSEIAETYQFIFHTIVQSSVLAQVVLQDSEIEAWDVVTKEQVADVGDRIYSQAVMHWAEKRTGYIEQSFGRED